MAEERVVLEVKFEESLARNIAGRAAEKGTSVVQRARQNATDLVVRAKDAAQTTAANLASAPITAEIVSNFKQETRAKAGDLLGRLGAAKERIEAAKATAAATRAGTNLAGGGGTAANLIKAAGGPLAIAAGAAVVALTAAAASVYTFAVVLKKATESAKELSSVVARAAAIGERNVLFARLQQARQLGPDIARSVRARSEVDVALIQLQTAFIKVFLPAALPFIESAADVLKLVSKAATTIIEAKDSKALLIAQGALIALIEGGFRALIPGGNAMVVLKDLARIWQRKQDQEDVEDPEAGLDQFLDPANWNSGRFIPR